MGKRIPSYVDDKIVSLWLQGAPRPTMETEVAVSAGKIDSVVKAEKQLIGEGNVDALRRLAMAVGKYHYGTTNILDAIRFLNTCAIQTGMDTDAVIEAVPRLENLRRKYQLRPEDVPMALENDMKSCAALEGKRTALQKQVAEIEEKIPQKLKQAGLIEESLAKFNDWCTFLIDHHLSPEEPEKLKNAFLNAEEAGYDVNSLVNKVSTVESLDLERTDLTQVVQGQRQEIKENQLTISGQNVQIAKASELLEKESHLTKLGCTPEMLGAIAQTVKRMAAEGDLYSEQAVEKFVNDVQTSYEPLAGFERAIGAKRKEKTDLDASVERLRAEYSRDSHAINALQSLYDNGMKGSDLFGIKYLVEKDGGSLSEINSKLCRYNSLGDAIRNREALVKDLDTKSQELQREISIQEKIKTGLEHSNNYLQFMLKKSLDSVIQEVRNRSAQIHSESIKLVEASTKARQDFSANMEDTVGKVLALGEAADEATERYAKAQGILKFEPLVRALGGERVDAKVLLNPALVAMTILLVALPRRSECRYQLQTVIENLRGDIEIDFFA